MLHADSNSGVFPPLASAEEQQSGGDPLRGFIENSPDAVFVCDRSERLIWVNAQAEQITGYSAAELASMRVTDLFDAESRRGAAVAIRRRLASRERQRHEVRIHTKDGVPVDLEIFSWVVVNHGCPAWIQVIARDITDAKRREEQAHRTEQAQLLSFLAGGVAHDFNNLLMAIYSYADQLRSGAGEVSSREAAEIIQQTAERGIEMASRLLRSATGASPEIAEMDLHLTITGLVNLLQQTIGAGIEVRVELNAATSHVFADSSQIYQVLLNLAMNARDAMPNGGVIVFRTGNSREPTGEMVYVEVADNGAGIPPALLNRIFEPFFTTKDTGKGTGMGLALVNGIVKNHHGRITVDSEAGRGTTFRVSLPLPRHAVAGRR